MGRKRRVLGIDPGTATTGYGIVEQDGNELRALVSGVIRTDSGQPTPDRL
ncbi:MAG: crossover junction endodeoxyribonuclease RuvC, partial [Anaerolineae bacterium]